MAVGGEDDSYVDDDEDIAVDMSNQGKDVGKARPSDDMHIPSLSEILTNPAVCLLTVTIT